MHAGPIKFKRLHEGAKLPRRATNGSVGFDLYAVSSCTLFPNSPALIDTHIACEIPDGYCGQIWPRSGKSVKHCASIDAGLIDFDFRGSIKVALFNKGDRPWYIEKGERIAQMVVLPVLMDSVEVDELTKTERGSGGFGSTGF